MGPGFDRRRGDLKGTEVGAGGDGEDVCDPVAPLEHREAREELLPGGVLAASPRAVPDIVGNKIAIKGF